MKIAMFLDVDGVLTAEPINLQLARIMGVEKDLIEVEQQYAMNEINNDEFNRKFIPLFRDKGFSEQFVLDKFNEVRMRINYEGLLDLGIDTYLVSSGPNYFIDILAQKFSIPQSRIMCSKYKFDKNGIIFKCERAVSGNAKADFVEEVAKGYDLNIGIGDEPALDAAFLSQCDIRILMGDIGFGYIIVRDIDSLIGLVQGLIRKIQRSTFTTDEGSAEVSRKHEAGVKKLIKYSPYEKNVFIMTPFKTSDPRYGELIRTIKEELGKFGLKGWTAKDRQFGGELWENVQCYLLGCKYGVAVFTQQQKEEKVASSDARYNPNVAIEVGYMFSRGKQPLLLKEKSLKSLPTDLMGKLYKDFDLDAIDASIPPIIREWVQHTLGLRKGS